jgi:opacity protein-like surface antigen
MQTNSRRLQRTVTAIASAALLLTAAASVSADPYIAANLGVAIQGDSDLALRGGPSAVWPSGFANGTGSYATGWVVGGAAGWTLRDFRLELAGSYSANSLDSLRLGPVWMPAPGGIQVVGGMANVYYDFPLRERIKPYVGGGVGVAYMIFETNTTRLRGGVYVDDSDTRVAGNVMAGVGFGLTDHLVLDLGYRFFAAADGTFESEVLPGFPFSRVTVSVIRHDVTAGLRYSF